MIRILQSQQIVQSIVIVYGRNTKALPDIFHSIDCDLEIDTCRLNLWFKTLVLPLSFCQQDSHFIHICKFWIDNYKKTATQSSQKVEVEPVYSLTC